MGMLELPKAAHPDFQFYRQRFDAVEIDWDNPLTKGLATFAVPLNGGTFDLVSRQYLSKHSNGSLGPNLGMMARTFTGGSGVADTLDGVYPSTLSMTLGAVTQHAVVGNDDGFAGWNSASGNFKMKLTTNNSTGLGFRVFAKSPLNNGFNYTGGPEPADGKIHRVIASMTGGGRLKMDVNNLGIQSTSKSGSTADIPSRLYYGSQSGGGGTFSGSNYCVYSYGRQLSDAEMLAVNANPFMLLRPRIPLFYALPEVVSSSTYTLIADAGSYALSGANTGLIHNRVLAAEPGNYALTGADTGLLHNRVLTAESGAYALTGADAGLFYNRVLTAEAGSYALSGQDADLFHNRVLTAESGSYTLTGADTDLLHNRVLTAESGSYVLTGYDVTLDYSGAGAPTYTLTADAGSYALSGSATSLLHNRRLAADSGSYSITGQDAGLYKGYRLVAEAGAYNLTGQVVDFSRAYRLEAESGTYTLTGQDTQILHNRRLVAESGTYTLTGYDVSLIYSPGATYTLTAESGSYALSGADTDLLHNRVLAAESGSYVLTGADAGIFHNRLLTAESGNYTLTGADVGFARSYRLAAESGGYGLTGSDVQLLYSGIAGEITGLLFKARLNRLPLTFKGSLGAEIVTYAPLNSGGIANRGRLNV